MHNMPATISILDNDSSQSSKQESRDMWLRNLWLLRSYVVSSLESLPDIQSIGKGVVQSIDDISSTVAYCYDAVCATKLASFIKTCVALIAIKIEKLKSGESIKEISKSDSDAIDSWASYMESLNPVYWKKDTIRAPIEMMFNLWINSAMARMAGEWDLDLLYMMRLESEMKKFADIFSLGIARRHRNLISLEC